MCVSVSVSGFLMEKHSIWLTSCFRVLPVPPGTYLAPYACSISQGKVRFKVTWRCAMSQGPEKHKVNTLESQFCCWRHSDICGLDLESLEKPTTRGRACHKLGPQPRMKQGRGWDSKHCGLFAQLFSCLFLPSSLDLLQGRPPWVRGKMPRHRATCIGGERLLLHPDAFRLVHPSSLHLYPSISSVPPSPQHYTHQVTKGSGIKFSFFSP